MWNKYRKKPIIIEAIQYIDNENELFEFVGEKLKKLNNYMYGEFEYKLIIRTLEGNIEVKKNDFVIKGINGEFYPCKPDIFIKTYEEVKECD